MRGRWNNRQRTNRSRPSPAVPALAVVHQPPVLSNISSGVPNATDATITWDTDILADSHVFWGLTAPAYGGATSPVIDRTRVTSHSVLITGLVTATTYHYKVMSISATGSYALSADGTFITA